MIFEREMAANGSFWSPTFNILISLVKWENALANIWRFMTERRKRKPVRN